MTDSAGKSDLQKTWEMAAPGWAKWERTFDTAFSRATDVLIDMAEIESGMRVLDIGCGAGSQSIQAANRVGPDGQVVASDISGTMLEHVQQNAIGAGVGNIETVASAADNLDASLGPFDAAICRMALMLFPAPQAALQALLPLLNPGARFSALVFSTPANNPFLALPMPILLRHAGKAPPPPGSPGIFTLGGDGVLEELLAENGFDDIRAEKVEARVVLPSAAEALHLMQEAAGAYRAVVADLDEEARTRAWEEVHECIKEFETGEGFEANLEVIVGSGKRPD